MNSYQFFYFHFLAENKMTKYLCLTVFDISVYLVRGKMLLKPQGRFISSFKNSIPNDLCKLTLCAQNYHLHVSEILSFLIS